MVLKRALIALIAAWAIFLGAGTPASAHRHPEPAAEQPIEADDGHHAAGEAAANHHEAMDSGGMDSGGMEAGGMTMGHDHGAEPTTFFGKLVNWLGRLHPMLVHFPLALLPMALVAILVARRRPEWTHTAHVFVITAGLAIVPTALLGWLDGGWDIAGDDNLLTVHRWLGTGIALAGVALALLVWRGRPRISHPASIFALVAINIALIAQGWYGGAMVHGADHLAW